MWLNLITFLLLGYLVMTRSFAYLGVPYLNLFLGELALALFLITQPKVVPHRWIGSLARNSSLSGLSWALLVFVLFGIFQLARGITLGHPGLTALQNFVFHSYPFYFFLGLWAALQKPDFLARVIQVLAWVNGLYGMSYILVLNGVPWMISEEPSVPVFGQPVGSAVAILGLLCFNKKLGRIWVPLFLNAFVMLGIQARGEWLGFALGLLVYGLLGRKPGRVAVGATTLLLFLVLGLVTEFELPSPAQRGGAISTRDILGRGLAPLNEDLAAELTENYAMYAGTVVWRTTWWEAIWVSVHQDLPTILIGHGYGFPLSDLVPYLMGTELRTPHNMFLYALGYGGWLGVLFFAWFQGALAHLLWRAYRLAGQPFGFAIWLAIVSGALFGNVFETPYGAIPFYLLAGLSAAPALADSRSKWVVSRAAASANGFPLRPSPAKHGLRRNATDLPPGSLKGVVGD